MCENDFMRNTEATPLDMLKALGDPVRLRVISALTVPRTVKQVGEYLGEDAGKLYYHVKELYRVGLVDLVETRVAGGVAEKYYRAVQVHADDAFREQMNELAQKDPAEAAKMLTDVVNSMLASVLTEFSWVTSRMRTDPGADHELAIHLHGRFLELTPANAKALSERLERALTEAGDDEGEAAHRYYLVSLLFPIRPEAG
jgi:DNA-binding transcriptional ArsR family regulator